MRFVIPLVAFLLAVSARAQADADSLSVLLRVERAAWASADEALTDADGLFRVDTTEVLTLQLRRIRQRAYEMGRRAARADLLFQLAAALRQDRGDAVPRCADEAAMAQHLDMLIVGGDDLVEMDASSFSAVEPFDPEAMAARVDALIAPARVLIDEHLDTPQDVCTAAPEPHHPPGHRP